MRTIIFLIIAVVLLIGTIILTTLANKKFHDRSQDVEKGMNEDKVIEIMEKEPLSIERLKNGKYAWIYEIKQWVGWAMMTVTIQIMFDETKLVTSVERSKSYERENPKKEK